MTPNVLTETSVTKQYKPIQPTRKIKWPCTTTRLTAHFLYGLMTDLVIYKHRKAHCHHDSKFTYWDQVSLNNRKNQHTCSFGNSLVTSWAGTTALLTDMNCPVDKGKLIFACLSIECLVRASFSAQLRNSAFEWAELLVIAHIHLFIDNITRLTLTVLVTTIDALGHF